jgi:hypothetical protein
MPKVTKPEVSTNFLLTSSQASLEELQLARLGEVANLRKELQEIVDRIVDNLSTAALASWFRQIDRELLRKALENEEDVMAWAQAQIRNQGRSGSELLPAVATLSAPGAAHRSAAMRYQQNNIADGKCRLCPEPLDRNSTAYCTAHLQQVRECQRTKSKKLNKPAPGRAPGSLAALAKAREEQASKREKEDLCESQSTPE